MKARMALIIGGVALAVSVPGVAAAAAVTPTGPTTSGAVQSGPATRGTGGANGQYEQLRQQCLAHHQGVGSAGMDGSGAMMGSGGTGNWSGAMMRSGGTVTGRSGAFGTTMMG